MKEYEAEELASDSDDEKRIRKAQERALKKKQNAFKKSERNKTPLSAHTSRTADDRSLF